MIHIIKQPEIKPYLPQPVTIAWIKTRVEGHEKYRLEQADEIKVRTMNAGLGNRRLAPFEGNAYATLTLLESGAVLASFPLLGSLPGTIQTDPFTVWFNLDAPARLPPAVWGKEIEIAAGRHLMTQALSCWIVFFKPMPNILVNPGT